MSKQPTIDETRELLRNLSSTLAAELCGIAPRHLRRLANVLAGESQPAVVRKILQDEVRRVRQGISDTSARMAREQTLSLENAEGVT